MEGQRSGQVTLPTGGCADVIHVVSIDSEAASASGCLSDYHHSVITQANGSRAGGGG